MKNKLVIIFFSILSLFGLFVFEKYRFDDGKLHVVFCDVGQGDAIFIRSPSGVDILIDAGPDNSVLECLSSHMPFWDRDIELAFLTHPHADHLAGFIEVLKRYNVMSFNTEMVANNTQVFQSLERSLKEKNIKKRYLLDGDTFKTQDGVALITLWPTYELILQNQEASNTDIDKNSFSLVQHLKYKDTSILLTGDIQAQILNNLILAVDDIDVLKIPHHGSKTGIDEKTFDTLQPQIAIISVGKNNRYKHPSEQVLSILKKEGIDVLRTDLDGEIEIIVSEKGFEVKK